MLQPDQQLDNLSTNQANSQPNYNAKNQTQQRFEVDQEQAIKQLSLLGYGQDETIYLRFLGAKNYKNYSKKATCTLKRLPKEQNYDQAIYFVVNGQSQSAEGITQGRALFCEWDVLEKEQQWQKLDDLEANGFPRPTFIVETRHSLHCYWTFIKKVAIADWKALQKDMIAFVTSDKALHDAPRIMRLAGGWHTQVNKETGEFLKPFQCRIVGGSEKTVDYEVLRKLIPESTKEQPTTITGRNFNEVSANDQERLIYDILDHVPIRQGGTNSYEVYREIGCVLKNLLGEAEAIRIMEDKTDASSAWNPEQVVKSSNGNFTMGTLVKHARDNFNWNYPDWYTEKYAKRTNNKVIQLTSKKQQKTLKQAISELLDETLTGSELETKQATIAKEYETPVNTIKQVYNSLAEELERKDARDANKAELQQLIDIQDESIPLNSFLPQQIATPITALASRLNLRPEVFGMSLITGLSASLERGTKLSIDGSGWVVRPNLYFAPVANSSQKKSPILNSMVKTPLGVIQSQERDNYEASLKNYEIAIEKYSNLRKKPDELAEEFPNGPPEKPVMKLNFITNLTLEGVLKQLGRQERGLIAVCDELAGLFRGLNQYKSGGNDSEVVIELYDGSDMSILRAKDEPVPLESPLFSIVGGVQPGVLKELFAKGDDNGNWARFCFIRQPLAATELNVDAGDIDISEPIQSLYQKFSKIPLTHYKLTYQARKLYFDAANQFEKERVQAADHPLGNVLGKASGLIGKLAITLHGIKYCCQGLNPPEEIEPDTIASAITLTNFLVNQSRSLYAELMGEDADSLPAHLVKLIDFIKRQPNQVTTIREIVRNRKAKDRSHALELLTELSEMRFGELVKAGKSFQFQLNRIGTNQSSIGTQLTQELAHSKDLYSKDLNRIGTIDTQKNSFSLTSDVNKLQNDLSYIESCANCDNSLPNQPQIQTEQAFNPVPIPVTIAVTVDDTCANSCANDNNVPIVPIPVDGIYQWQDLIRCSDSLISTLGWSLEQAQDYLRDHYGVNARIKLTDEQFLDFVKRLETFVQQSSTTEVA